MTRYYLVKDRKRHGPFTIEELAANGLERTSLVWRQGMTTWTRAEQLPELAELLLTLPPSVPPGFIPHEPADVEAIPSPALFQGLILSFNILFLSGMIAAGVSSVGYILWLQAKADMLAVSPVQAFMNNPYKVGDTVVAPQDLARYNEARDRLNKASHLTWTSGIVTLLILTPAAILFAVFLSASWALVQDEKAKTTPDLAGSLLFIPVFNFVWIFVAMYDLTWSLNRVARSQGETGPRVSPGLALTCCVLFICLFVPVLCALAIIPTTFLLMIVMHQIKVVSTHLARARGAT